MVATAINPQAFRLLIKWQTETMAEQGTVERFSECSITKLSDLMVLGPTAGQ